MKAYSFIATALAAALAAGALRAQACTRVLYQGPAETVLTGRTMDWKEDPESRLWLFPRGMHRSGAAGENSLEWVSKYGSVITSAYDICTTDGMNEKGLAANLLWLAESVFPIPDANRKALSVSIWAQYVLDCFATVAEVVERFSTGDLDVVSDWMPDGSRPATLHLSISDATGDSAIFEYIGGKLAIHHDRAYTVMTNSPVFEQQLALDDYWNGIGGLVFLPTGSSAPPSISEPSPEPTTSAMPQQPSPASSATYPCRWAFARRTNRTSPRPDGARWPTRKTESTITNRPSIRP